MAVVICVHGRKKAVSTLLLVIICHDVRPIHSFFVFQCFHSFPDAFSLFNGSFLVLNLRVLDEPEFPDETVHEFRVSIEDRRGDGDGQIKAELQNLRSRGSFPEAIEV